MKHDESITLELGENVIEIVVTAEDESSRTYTLTIVRQEQKKSNNTNITTYVNEEEITFKDYKAEIEFETDALAITHDLEDKKSQTTLDKQYTIDKAESTTLQFIVTAEDGTTRNYEINFIYVNKETNSISGSEIVASLIVFSGFLAVPTYFITKRKNNYRIKITNKL